MFRELANVLLEERRSEVTNGNLTYCCLIFAIFWELVKTLKYVYTYVFLPLLRLFNLELPNSSKMIIWSFFFFFFFF